jgi:hypothetical protein
VPGLFLGLALLLGVQNPPPAAPVFRSDVYAVPFEFTATRRLPFGIRRPQRGLTRANVRVALDGRLFEPMDVREDPQRAGHYFVSFTPPDIYRDGLSHPVGLRFRTKGGWWTPPGVDPAVVFPRTEH